MPRPIPTYVAHFTHVDNLAGIVTDGLVCDAHSAGHLVTEAGEPRIKRRRKRRTVTVGPGGVVADYVPFYFAPRSPMMSSIHHRSVATFTGDEHDLVYLVTTVERLIDRGHDLVFTDRNAALGTATHFCDTDRLNDLVDWDLMEARIWRNTDTDFERKERRMAECLVHGRVDFATFEQISVYDEGRASTVETTLRKVGAPVPHIRVKRRS